MDVGGRGDRHGVDVVTGEQGVEVVGVGHAVLRCTGTAAIGVVVPDGDQFGAGMFDGASGVVAGVDVPEADCGDAEGEVVTVFLS
ncbi:hypothetical protein GCM10025867_19310 [Frondihabitans sucicola]|uniref:Uncharacterized protein n=1 Tax=Frondihabitans sucicola TaxID=1268041 RepID=A0ABN6XXH8_9MICO|nr:hypothetical protein GCM10025867_19310 [Frondihabitans sucicola]